MNEQRSQPQPSAALPGRDEAPEYYFKYIDLIGPADIHHVLEAQASEMRELFASISEAESTTRYSADKWSIRQVLGHVIDCERLFTFRAFWFARGFDSALPAFDQETASRFDASAERPWATLVKEFHQIRAATLSFFGHLPADAWRRHGSASGGEFTVRALAHITAGHVSHHAQILRDRYLGGTGPAADRSGGLR